MRPAPPELKPPGRWGGAVRWRPARREPSRPGYEASRILEAFGRPVCPICHDAAEHDRTFFFWFLNESYSEAYYLDALTRSLGFCRTHAARLAAETGGAYQLAFVHKVVAGRVRRTLAAGPAPSGRTAAAPFGTPAACPACACLLETQQRDAAWTARLLAGPDGERYGRPGVLCFPHLQAVVPGVPRPVLERLLALHERAARAAAAALTEGPEAVAAALRLAVGHERPSALPALDSGPAPRRRDPVDDLVEGIRLRVGCPPAWSAGASGWSGAAG